MASTMKAKFDKYWGDYSLILALGCVLDPKAKLQFLNFCYRKLYQNDYLEKVNMVKRALYKLFNEYEDPSNSSRASSSNYGHPYSTTSPSTMPTSMLDEYHQELKQLTSNDGKSQLDLYLEEGCIVGNDIDALEYWKVNKHRFPQLSIMSCNVLSIPITTIASESSFSIEGRILHKYRSRLLPENVQALICTRNWLHGFKEVGPLDLEELEEIRLPREDYIATNESNQ